MLDIFHRKLCFITTRLLMKSSGCLLDYDEKTALKKPVSSVDRLQLDARQKTDSLSLGSRKKVSIVCALQHNPDLCIFDEPTSGLDPLIQKEFFEILKERNKQDAQSSFPLIFFQRFRSTAPAPRSSGKGVLPHAEILRSWPEQKQSESLWPLMILHRSVSFSRVYNVIPPILLIHASGIYRLRMKLCLFFFRGI